MADPSLDLTDARVRDQVFGADVDDRTREATVRAQEDLFNRLRAEEFGPEAVPPSPPAGQAQYADPAQPGEYPELFGDVNVDELLRSGAGADDSTWQLETPGPWFPAANPIAPSALTHLPGLEGQAPAYALSQAMENLSVTASHFPTADSYGAMSQHTNVAYTQWDTSAFQQPNTQPAPQTNAYQMGRPGGRTGRSGRPPRQ
ncbi:hypothetical protein [Streptomyces axinellae]|uniref:hypothetical protein n=1 Tax=Streptomyces axinellae TaxID=552788 RepID=UPI0031D0330D